MQIKQQILSALRSTGLLPLAERLHLSLDTARTKADNEQFCLEQPGFIPPPLPVIHDAHGSTSFRQYWEGGRLQAKIIAELIRENHPGAGRILEWGCGPGRILRHMPALMPRGTQFVGSDFNKEGIAWCRRAISDITFSTNELAPPLPFKAASFDVIYAISVFTHLSISLQDSWIKELRRVLRPDGILILTVHGELSACRLLPREYKQFLSKGVVIRNHVREGKLFFLSYHHPQYAANHLFAGLQVRRRIPGTSTNHQDVWILSKLEPVITPFSL